ncbi:MAG: DM13 domain-containing protein [Acidimicrobiia bacterium]
MPTFIARHKIVTTVAALCLAAMAWLAFGYFEVQAAFIDDRVAEAAPSPSPDGANPFEAVAQGSFTSLAHDTSGIAKILDDGTRRVLRFEQFTTSNGPDLNVYLVKGPGGSPDDGVDLGNLKGNIGDQNYEIGGDVDLAVYDTVVIWCVRFSSAFGEATVTSTT